MTRPVDSPPEQPNLVPQPPHTRQRSSSMKIITLLVVIGLLVLLFTGLLVRNLTQVVTRPAARTQQTSVAPRSPAQVQAQKIASLISLPGDAPPPAMDIPTNHEVLYEQNGHIYTISTDENSVPVEVYTPGFIYLSNDTSSPNRSLLPILTPSGQLLYSGNGLWLIDPFNGPANQIATLDQGQIITSVALSKDGTSVAWSTEPINGSGSVRIFAGPLADASLVYEHSADDCPCFRVFSFSSQKGQQSDTTLLLTDDRGDHHAVQYGLWSFDLAHLPLSDPVPLLDENPGQAPLAISPDASTFLYTTYSGFVPAPTDASVPDEAQDQTYANSLYLTTLDSNNLSPKTSLMLLPEQHNLNTSSVYRWASTPIFSPDGHTIIYIEFSNDTQDPYDRHNAIYTAQISGTGAQLEVSKPQLMATTSSYFIELGSWLNAHMLTFYADGELYVLDYTTGAYAPLVSTSAYDRVIAVIGEGT